MRLGKPASVGEVHREARTLMGILIYKRTHTGDPDLKGSFGIHDCMGRVRDYDYDAVIGVGGIGQEPRSFGIDRKVNWVGISPKRKHGHGTVSGSVTFKHFRLYDKDGPLLKALAPALAARMYRKGARILLANEKDAEYAEAAAILGWSSKQRQRPVRVEEHSRGCRVRCRPA